MKRLMLVVCSALMLVGCSNSKTIGVLSSPRIPDPPAAALIPCSPGEIPFQANGAQLASDSFKAQMNADIKLAECQSKVRLLLDAWPKNK